MSGGGIGLSKLGTALTVIFTISLVALLAELFYVLWRHRVFRRRTNTVAGSTGDQLSQYSSSDSTSPPMVSSKELLYFFCIRPQPRLEHNPIVATAAVSDLSLNRQPDVEVIDIDLMKIQGMFGPPRFLFTIKEEEKEGLESPAEKSLRPSADISKGIDDHSSISRVSLEECLKASVDESVVAVTVEIDDSGGHDTTPFFTPCASPLYFTPSASPVHEVVNDRSSEEERIGTEGYTGPLARPEV